MAFFPNPGLRGGSAEWEPQEGQSSVEYIDRMLAPPPPSVMQPAIPWGQDPDVSNAGRVPNAPEFQPDRPLTQAEIAETQQPGGSERVAARLQAERAALEDHERRYIEEARRFLAPRDGGADLPMAPGAPFRNVPGAGGLPQTAPLPPSRPKFDARQLAQELLRGSFER
jgi:hypothetical protein